MSDRGPRQWGTAMGQAISRVLLIESMNTTRELVYGKQVMSPVILELWHRAFVDKAYSLDR